MAQKIVIIGGGIAGLSAGIYAQKAGFDSVVYEKHSVPGGQCTGWMREGHYIDNCICWMTCAKEGYDLWEMWKDSAICADGIGSLCCFFCFWSFQALLPPRRIITERWYARAQKRKLLRSAERFQI